MTYFTHKGIFFTTLGCSEKTLISVENEFQLLDDDVVTVTYPKSGTNWMLEILGLIQRDGDPSWVRSVPVWDRSPWIETDVGLETALKYPPPRLLASHLPFQLFPKSFLKSKTKVIYVLRNPKDVLISHYHFSKSFKGFKMPGTMEDFMETFLKGDVPYGSWFDHVRGWMEMKDRPNFFFFTYEELQHNPRDSVKRLCQILGKDLNSQQIDSVLENASFQKMKDNNMSNFTLVPEIHFDHNTGKFMRKDNDKCVPFVPLEKSIWQKCVYDHIPLEGEQKYYNIMKEGISGDWKNHLTVAQSEYFDRVYQEKMQNVNVTFQWD